MSAGSTKIVVGVDGSPSSRAALRWAVRQAALTGGTVDAIMAWHVPVALTGYTWAPISVDEADNLEEDARMALDALLGSVGRYCVHHAHCPVLVMRGEPGYAAA